MNGYCLYVNWKCISIRDIWGTEVCYTQIPIFVYYQLCKIHKLPVVYHYFQNSLFSSKHWVIMYWHLLSKYVRSPPQNALSHGWRIKHRKEAMSSFALPYHAHWEATKGKPAIPCDCLPRRLYPGVLKAIVRSAVCVYIHVRPTFGEIGLNYYPLWHIERKQHFGFRDELVR